MKILKFYSDTCGPCKVMSENLAKAEIPCTEIDVYDENNEGLIEKYDITGIPTLVILDDRDEVVEKFTGITSIDAIKGVLCNL